ncbi:MAG: pyruvate dehydrogenase (acetyl-transferring) E1 component subunit alpha [Phycisphaerae bacterium]|nr:pyruvate dehydrogenase (acetyl-transferring) E1 component subunit alpha [Phycisphaerae bacterium]
MPVEVPQRPPAKKPTETNDGRIERDRLRMMMLIRRFEERTYSEYTKPGQKIGGFCHLYSGQEAIAVGTAALFDKNRDYLINGYRCHGHSLALGMSPRTAMAELFGKATGCSKGKGGSMHLFDASVGNNGGHGIVGGQLPLGAGMAFAQWYKKTGGVTFTFMGDGAINQGTHNEALNLASLWKLPVIWVIENNGVAMGTQVARHSAEKDLAKRGSGYNMPFFNVDGNDLDRVIEAFGEAVERARSGGGPTYFSANTYRFRGHSMSDAMKYRTKDEMEKAKARDPIALYEVRLREKGLLTDEHIEALEESVNAEVAEAIAQADQDPHPPLEDRFNDVLSETYPYEPK